MISFLNIPIIDFKEEKTEARRSELELEIASSIGK